MTPLPRLGAAATALAMGALLLTGCGSSTASSTASGAAAQGPLPGGGGVMTKPTGVSASAWAAAQKACASLAPTRSAAPSASSS